VRIISGKFGGRRLTAFTASHIRPTSDRVKESLFNILQERWDEARVLDLFSGTGNLGIEALSRGASWVEFVDDNVKSIMILKKNLETLGIKSQFKIHKSDAFKFLKKHAGKPFDLILVDPPFTEKISHPVMLEMSKSSVHNQDSMICIESSTQEQIEDEYGNLVCVDRRHFGDKVMSFFKRKGG